MHSSEGGQTLLHAQQNRSWQDKTPEPSRTQNEINTRHSSAARIRANTVTVEGCGRPCCLSWITNVPTNVLHYLRGSQPSPWDVLSHSYSFFPSMTAFPSLSDSSARKILHVFWSCISAFLKGASFFVSLKIFIHFRERERMQGAEQREREKLK